MYGLWVPFEVSKEEDYGDQTHLLNLLTCTCIKKRETANGLFELLFHFVIVHKPK